MPENDSQKILTMDKYIFSTSHETWQLKIYLKIKHPRMVTNAIWIWQIQYSFLPKETVLLLDLKTTIKLKFNWFTKQILSSKLK